MNSAEEIYAQSAKIIVEDDRHHLLGFFIFAVIFLVVVVAITVVVVTIYKKVKQKNDYVAEQAENVFPFEFDTLSDSEEKSVTDVHNQKDPRDILKNTGKKTPHPKQEPESAEELDIEFVDVLDIEDLIK